MSNGVKRIITAAILVAVALPLVILGGVWLDVALVVATTACVYEMMNVRKISKVTRAITIASYPIICSLFMFDVIGIKFIPLVMLVLFLGQVFAFYCDKEDSLNDCFYRTLSYGLLLFAGLGLSYFSSLDNRLYMIGLLAIPTMFTDMGAYFVGSRIGKRKLIVKVSPNKSVEGAVGGYVAGVIGALAMTLILKEFCLATAIASFVLPFTCQVGDLLFSAIKRNYGVKDFSNLLPGHGGASDRLDSLIINTLVLLSIIVYL